MQHPHPKAMMDRAIDEHFGYEACDDVEGVLATLAHDVDHDVVGSPTGPVRGRDEARSFYDRLFADLEQGDVSSTRRYYGPDFVVDESRWRGTAVGNPLGFAGRNRPLDFRILHLFEFGDDGAIRRENVWMDTLAIAAQLRDDPAPAVTPSDAKALVQRFYADFDRGELARFAAFDPGFTATVFGTTVLDWPGFVAFRPVVPRRVLRRPSRVRLRHRRR
jgi:ketosteroid isomerase-like protein